MKPLICKCQQCRAARARTKKSTRIQTKQIRAARHQVKIMLNKLPYDLIDDMLPETVKVDYYG